VTKRDVDRAASARARNIEAIPLRGRQISLLRHRQASSHPRILFVSDSRYPGRQGGGKRINIAAWSFRTSRRDESRNSSFPAPGFSLWRATGDTLNYERLSGARPLANAPQADSGQVNRPRQRLLIKGRSCRRQRVLFSRYLRNP